MFAEFNIRVQIWVRGMIRSLVPTSFSLVKVQNIPLHDFPILPPCISPTRNLGPCRSPKMAMLKGSVLLSCEYAQLSWICHRENHGKSLAETHLRPLLLRPAFSHRYSQAGPTVATILVR